MRSPMGRTRGQRRYPRTELQATSVFTDKGDEISNRNPEECDRSRARRGRHLSRQLYIVDKREVKDDAEVCQ